MIDLVPLKLFSERIKQGWTMVHGYPLSPGDYAVTMMSPDHYGDHEEWRRKRQLEGARKAGAIHAKKMAARTHCKRGHALTDDNVRVGPRGERHCRECTNWRERKRYAAISENSRAGA